MEMTNITIDTDISISFWQNLQYIFFLLITNWLVPNWGRSTKLYIVLFNLYTEYIIWYASLDESQAGIKIAGGNINNLRYVDYISLMAESKEKLKSLLMKEEEESERADLKLNIQNTKTLASSLIISQQIEREKVVALTGFIFWAPKSLWTVTATIN